MARVAPGEGGDRNTTGTQSGFRTVLRNGDVLRVQDHFVVLWQRTEDGWVGFPVVPQTGPLHRSHVVLTPAEVAPFCPASKRVRMVVRTSQPERVSGDARLVGVLNIEVARRIGQTLRRALDASLSEGGRVAL
jgi:hypothetical protein